ncbi:MAG: hypothetical protein IJR70_03440 [Eubacterium sp.]|nr:hypothetical protein [Eubacterium sp.]
MKFETFISNQKVKEQLEILIDSGRFPHALIIEGDEGIGKKTLAREIALSLMCISEEERPCRNCAQCNKVLKGVHPDICEYGPDESKKTRPFTVDTVRDIINDAAVKPNESQYKIYFLYDCERMNTAAQNALLKLIEEPPEYALFILCTQTKSAFLETVLSRSVVISLQGVDFSEGAHYICENNPDINYNDALHSLSVCNGNIGKALESLSDGKLQKYIDIANELALSSISANEYDLIKTCGVFERDKTTLIGALTFLKSIFRDAVVSDGKSNMISNQKETVRKLSSVLSKGKLLKMSDVCSRIINLAQSNGNNAILITKLCYELRRAQNR